MCPILHNYIFATVEDEFELPIIIVQHRSPDFGDYLEMDLNERCKIAVKQVDEKERMEAVTAYLAPPNYHLLVEKDRTFSLSVSAPVNYSRPSIDVLFETAADA